MSLLRRPGVGYPAAALLVVATVACLKLFRGLTDSTVALVLLLAVFLSASDLAERARRPRRAPRDARVQLLLPAASLHVHDPGPAQRRGALRLPRVGPPDRPPLRPLPPPPRARRGGAPRPRRADAASPRASSRTPTARRCSASRRTACADALQCRAGRRSARRREGGHRRSGIDARHRVPRRPRRARLQAGQLRRVSLGARRHRHLSARFPSASSAPACSSRGAFGRASGWPRPAPCFSASPSSASGSWPRARGRGDQGERSDEVDAARRSSRTT